MKLSSDCFAERCRKNFIAPRSSYMVLLLGYYSARLRSYNLQNFYRVDRLMISPKQLFTKAFRLSSIFCHTGKNFRCSQKLKLLFNFQKPCHNFLFLFFSISDEAKVIHRTATNLLSYKSQENVSIEGASLFP